MSNPRCHTENVADVIVRYRTVSYGSTHIVLSIKVVRCVTPQRNLNFGEAHDRILDMGCIITKGHVDDYFGNEHQPVTTAAMQNPYITQAVWGKQPLYNTSCLGKTTIEILNRS